MNTRIELIHTTKKQYLQMCESQNIKLSKQQIKIPFISNIVHLQALGIKQIKKQKQMKQERQVTSPHRKYSYLVEHLCLKSKNNLSREHSEIHSEGGASRDSTMPLKSYKDSRGGSRFLENQEIQRKNDSPAQKYRKYLPILNIKQVNLKPIIQRDKPKKKRSISQQRQKSIMRSNSRLKILKKCYDMQVRNINSSSLSRKPSTRRIKTEQESTNQFLLQRILTVKPTLDLRRNFLTKKFEKTRQYLKIKQRKNISWAFQNVNPVSKTKIIHSQY